MSKKLVQDVRRDSMNAPLKTLICFFAIGGLAYPTLASAYIGPGLGLGTIATVLGVALGLLMLVVGAIWYPVKRLIRRIRSKK